MDMDYTHISVVLDRSGSMNTIKSKTEEGYNSFLREQAAAPGRATIELSQFDDVYETVYKPQDIKSAPPLRLVPRNSTALLDAIGRSVTSTGEWLAAMDEDARPGHVIMVIITDGLENASREWTKDAINELVRQQTETYAWNFVYLAANQDAIAVGAMMGFAKGSSMTYDSQNVAGAYAATSSSVLRTRSGRNTGFTDDERAEASSSSS